MKQALILILSTLIPILSCIKGNTEQANDLFIKGKKTFLSHDLKKARKLFKESLQHDNSLYNARLMLAKIDYFEKKFEASLQNLDQVLSKNPDHIGALYWKARTLIISGTDSKIKNNEEQAITALKRILEIDNHHLQARSLYALVLEKQGKYKEALYEYSYITTQEETIVNSRANLSLLYKRLGLHDKSLNEIKKAIEIARITKINDANLTLIKREIEK